MTITDSYAAELVAKLRAAHEARDELTAETPIDPRDLLILKLYDDLKALEKAMGFLGGGIKATRIVSG